MSVPGSHMRQSAFRSNTFAFRSIFFFQFQNFHHFYRTFATFSELSPLLGCVHFFHIPFAAPPRFRFHTDLGCPPRPPAPPQLTGGEHLVFPFRHFDGPFATFATFSELSPLLGCVHLFHVPFATPPRFRFHTDQGCPPRPPAPPQLTGGEHLVFPCCHLRNFRHFRHFFGTFATFGLCSPFSRSLRHPTSLSLPH